MLENIKTITARLKSIHIKNNIDQNIDQIVANQDQANEPVRPVQQLYSASRATVARAVEVLQTITVERHHARLRAGEERRDQDKNCQCCEEQAQRGVVQECLAPLLFRY